MSRAIEPSVGPPTRLGLRALAALVCDALENLNDAAVASVTQGLQAAARQAGAPVLAGAETSGLALTVEVGTSRPSGSRRPAPGGYLRHSGVAARPTPGPAADSAAAPVLEPGSAPPDPSGELPPPPESGSTQTTIDVEHAEIWQLVTLAQTGDGAAFGQLYDRYVDTVYRFIYFRVNDRALAEDFTSETFLRALRRIGTISYQGRDIGAWFVTIARNIVLDHLKSARYRLEYSTADTLEGNDRAPSPESAVLEQLTNERLMLAVQQLGDEQRECVILRFIQGFSVSETAAVMNKNDGAVKALQHRAIRKLAEIIGDDLR